MKQERDFKDRDRNKNRDRDKDRNRDRDRDRDRDREGRNFRGREESEEYIEGRNAVLEAIKSGRTVEKLYISKGEVEGSIKLIISLAKDRGIVIQEVDKKGLDKISVTKSHQGVIAKVSPFVYCEVEDILNLAREKEEDPFVIILDEIEDPHNFGSIIRTANSCGAHGIIIPKRRSASVTQSVLKVAAGAAENTKIAKVTNLNQTLKELKDNGLWIIGTDMDGEVCYNSNLKGPTGLVIGSEGKGMGRLIKENCDMIVRIPMKGSINSLNASVAAGIIMYEITRQRG